jgi:hypothetical protein
MPGLGASELIIILFILTFQIAGFVLPAVAFWKICTRLGFNGALGLLMLVPVANLVWPLYIAFASWPSCKAESDKSPENGVLP